MDRTAYTKMKIKEIQKKLEFVKHTKFRNKKKYFTEFGIVENIIQDSELKKQYTRFRT